MEAVFHEGACSDTMEQDGKYMMENNYEVSKQLFMAAQAQGSRLLVCIVCRHLWRQRHL